MRPRILVLLILLVLIPSTSLAGGPAFVAGSSFDPSVKGRALTWANNKVQYYTDQGDLSPILNSPQADAFVADVFTRWTTVPSASLTATRAGHLAEDVSGPT